MNDGRKKKPQKHQNKTAFKIAFDTLALEHQKKVSLSLLCKRCAEQISWKLQFNKYKKISQPSKCNFCHNKIVVRSYMKACDPCCEREGVCPKCLEKDVQIPQGEKVKLSAKEQAEKDKEQEKSMNDFVDSLKQRSRRKVRREYQKGIIEWDNQAKLFRDKEGNQLVGLKFKRKGLEDLEKQMDQDDLDDQKFSDQDEREEDDDEQQPLESKEKTDSKQNQRKSSSEKKKQKEDKDKEKIENNENNENEIGGDQLDEDEWQDDQDYQGQDDVDSDQPDSTLNEKGKKAIAGKQK